MNRSRPVHDLHYMGPEPLVINATGLPIESFSGSLKTQAQQGTSNVDRVVAQVTRWADRTKTKSRFGGILDRDKFVSPDTPFGQMRLAAEAVRDDVVGAAVDESELLAIAEISVFSRGKDEQAVWEAWSKRVDLGGCLRSAWRTLFIDSQFVVTSWWEPMRLELEDGREVTVNAPSHLHLLPTTRIVPVGMLLFGQEQLCYAASTDEASKFDHVLSGKEPSRFAYPDGDDGTGFATATDPVVERLIAGRYVPSPEEVRLLHRDGVKEVDRLFLLRPEFTWRHTLTRSAGQRFADVRLASVFELLDMKANLHQSDRAALIGSANYIVLITHGNDKNPIVPAELQQLQAMAQQLGQQPYIVGDHRLNVEILTPKTDNTLDQDKYDNLDTRIFTRVYQTFVHGSKNRSSDDSKTGALVAKGLEGRRNQMRQSFERNLFDLIRLNNPGVFTKPAELKYHPQNIAVAFDPGRIALIAEARSRNELSRESFLNELGYREADEAVRLEREAEDFDHIFLTQDPHGTPNPVNDPRSAGRSGGGNRNGGGAGMPGDGHGKPPLRPSTDELDGMLRDDLIVEAGKHSIPGRHQMRKTTLIDSIRAARTEETLDD